MRENINFNLPSVKLEGKYKIQLFDKNNILIEEIEQHNCINKGFFTAMFYDCMYYPLLNDRSENSNFPVPCRWLLLSNSELAIENDVKNPVIMGEIIGYAHYNDDNNYTYSKRGIINKNDSFIVDNYDSEGEKLISTTRHYAWDFTTDKGNGTFNNIYLTSGVSGTSNCDNNSIEYEKYEYGKYAELKINSQDVIINESLRYNWYDGGNISGDDNNIYVQCMHLAGSSSSSSSSYVEEIYDTIAKIDKIHYKINYIKLSVPSSEISKSAAIIYGGGLFWRIDSKYNCTRYTTNGEYKDAIDLKTLFSNVPQDITIANNYVTRISKFTGDEEYIYIAYSSGDKKYYVTVDKEAEKKSEILGNTTVEVFPISLLNINDKKYIVCNSDIFLVSGIGELTDVSNEFKSIAISYNYQMLLDKEGTVFKFSRAKNNSEYGFSPLQISCMKPWTSHIKLDTPITKTSATTMKIQYDITCEYVTPFSIKD